LQKSIQQPGWGIKIIYALGQLGWSLCAYGATNLITYFYLPPETGDSSVFPSYIFQGAIWGFITVIGLLTLSGRIFDAITDPLIANWSDRWNRSPGRRKPFLWIGAIPFALFSVLVFVPITDGESLLNSLWLAFTLFGFFFFMTIYVTPFTAWMSELGHTPNERLNISTIISVTWALGFGIGNFVHVLQANFEATMSSTKAFQLTMVIFAVLSAVLMLLPAIFINEEKYSLPGNSDTPPFKAAQQVFADKNFRTFAFTDFAYWMALTSIQLGMAYYVTVLIELDKSQITFFLMILFVLSFLFYIPINVISKKIGKKPIVSISFIIYMLVFAGILLGEYIRIEPKNLLTGLVALAALPIAVFGILPNAIIADLAEADSRATGENKAGMYYGVRMFMMKLGVSVTNFVFPALLVLGKSTDNPLGVKLTALFALIVCAVGWLIFRNFKEVEFNS